MNMYKSLYVNEAWEFLDLIIVKLSLLRLKLSSKSEDTSNSPLVYKNN